MEDQGQTVFVVDDEESVRESLTWLLDSIRLKVRTYGSSEQFLEEITKDTAGCLVLDVRMPGMSGPELMDRLRETGINIPIIFLSAHGDVPLAVRAIKGGAIDFLLKPYNNNQFVERVKQALAVDAMNRGFRTRLDGFAATLSTLSPREREIMDMVVDGKKSRAIGKELGISHKTVDAHRSRLMRKMGVTRCAELLQLVLTRH